MRPTRVDEIRLWRGVRASGARVHAEHAAGGRYRGVPLTHAPPMHPQIQIPLQGGDIARPVPGVCGLATRGHGAGPAHDTKKTCTASTEMKPTERTTLRCKATYIDGFVFVRRERPIDRNTHIAVRLHLTTWGSEQGSSNLSANCSSHLLRRGVTRSVCHTLQYACRRVRIWRRGTTINVTHRGNVLALGVFGVDLVKP